jgi:group II intron reverse transcriptase/maturase
MLITPNRIRTLQRKLYCKAKQEADFRFYSLYDKVYREDILSHAYHLVRANKGAPGIDGVSFEFIKEGKGEITFLRKLGQELREKRYQCQAVRRVWIPKPDGSQRPLGIPTIRDRVVQQALKLVIEPVFEADFCDCSYGFRPKRSAHDAVDAISKALLTGYCQVIDADLSKYFDTIPHAKLLAVVAERINDKAVLSLIKQWLKAPVIEEANGKRRTIGGGKGNRLGTPQGGVISPLLANLYLHLLDRIWVRRNLTRRYGAHLVRYADDLVILCKGRVDAPMQMVKMVLDKCDLRINEKKTSIVNARKEGFDFLGFSFQMRRSHRSGNVYPHVEPSKRSVTRVKAKVKSLTNRRRTPIPLPWLIDEVNDVVRGWSAYFHYLHSTKVMNRVKWFTEESVRKHLRVRYKVRTRTRGYGRFSTEFLYRQLGLYKIPTNAKWKQAQASQ